MEAREEVAPKPEQRKSFLQRSTKWQFPTFVASIFLAAAFMGFQSHVNRVEREALRPSFELAEILRIIEEGQYEEALVRLELFFSLCPESNLVAEAHLRKADVLASQVQADGDHGARALDFEDALMSAGAAGARPEAVAKRRLEMARVLASHQKYPEALKECDSGLRALPEAARSQRDEVKEWMSKFLVDYGDIAPEAALAEVGKRIFQVGTSPERAQLELVRGHILRRDGQFEEAEAAYGEVVELLPDSLAAAEAFYWQGMALFGREEFPDAYARFVYAGKLLGHVPPAEGASFHAGESLFRMGNYELALREFESCAYRFAGTEVAKAAMLRVGDASLKLEKFGEASAAYYRALEAAPLAELATNPLVDVETSLQELSKAAEKAFAAGDYLASYNLLKPLAAFGRPRDKFLYQSGLALLGMGRTADDPGEKRNLYLSAASALEQIAEEYPASELLPGALWNGAEALFEAGEYAAATDTYRRFAEGSWDDPRTSEAIYKRGLCYQKLGLYDAAIEVFRLNETSFPNVIHAYHSRYEKGCSYLAKGDAVAAQEVFWEIIRDPKFSPRSRVWRDALLSLGEAYCSSGDYAEAVESLQEALERYPEDRRAGEAMWLLAKALMAESRYLDATNELKQLASMLPPTVENVGRLTEVHLLLGDCFYTLQEYRSALDAYKNAVRYAGKAQSAGWGLFQIANCYFNLGEMQSAEAAYKRATLVISSLSDEAFAAAPPGLRKRFWEELLGWASSSTPGG